MREVSPAVSPTRPSAPRFALRLGLTVLAVALAAFVFRRAAGTEARFQKLLDLERQALNDADRLAFMSLQDRRDASWWAQQQEAVEWRLYNVRRGDAAAGEPPPAPRVVNVEVQGATARVLLETRQDGGPVRSVTFFRQGPVGWLHTGPQPQFWGAPRTRRGGSLVWLYRERDESWVAALLHDGEAMLQQLGQDLELAVTGPITVEVAYALDTAQAVYPAAPLLSLPTPLLAGVDERDMHTRLARALAGYVSAHAAGWRLRWEANSRGALLKSYVAWETGQLTATGLDARRAELLAAAAAAGELLSLAEVWPEPGLPTVGSPDLRYAQGWAAVDYIAARHGRQSLPALLRRLAGESSALVAVQAELGYTDLAAFESAWLQFTRDHYGRK